VLVAYGHAFGTLASALLAFLFERLINPSLSLFCFGILLEDSIVTYFLCSYQKGKQKKEKLGSSWNKKSQFYFMHVLHGIKNSNY
jgi:hypothetical protein